MGAVSPHVDHEVIFLYPNGVSMLEVTLNEKMCQRGGLKGGQKKGRVCKDAPSQQATTDAHGQCKC